MKLSATEIQSLYKFTRQHYVYHYDIQTELVDHLANDIEQIWATQPNLSFEEARDTSFKKFGVFGFMDVVDAKQKQMNKRYRKILWRFFKVWFTMPKLLLTIAIFVGLYLVLKIPYSEYIVLGSLLIICITDLIKQHSERKHQKNKKIENEKVFLLEAMIGTTRQTFSSLAFVNIFNIVNMMKFNFSSLDNNWLLLTSFCTTLLLIFFYVSAYVIPKKAEALLLETYPEYKLVKGL
ncbi:hypothetical protein [Polaribacter tangerinus]|uniref:hypothetical protein n=1 Tax=Polaribacter tangerinus TaxID=1920034 RepID=UPI000B4A99DA|nr:hypothetical protein [Polaribacter tangerinus]